MKKIVSLVLALLVMAMPMFAMAEGTGASVRLHDVELYIGDMTTPYAALGIDLNLTVSGNDEGGTAVLSLGNADAALTACAGVDNNGLTLYLDGMANAYHIAPETLQAIMENAKAQLEQQMGFSLDELPAKLEEMQQNASGAQDEMAQKLNESIETLMASMQVEQKGLETVTVFGQQMELTRIDFVLPAEALKQFLTDLNEVLGQYMEQFSTAMATMGMEGEFSMTELDVSEVGEITGTIWTNEEGTALLAVINFSDAEDAAPLNVQMLQDEAGVHLQLDAANETQSAILNVDLTNTFDREAGVMTVAMNVTVSATQNGRQVADMAIAAGMNMASDHNEVFFNLTATQDGQDVQMALSYAFTGENTESGMTHNGTLTLTASSAGTALGLKCSLDVNAGAVESTTLELPVEVLDLESLTEEQQQAIQQELQTVVQGVAMRLMSTEGVQKLMTLFMPAPKSSSAAING